MGKQLATQKGNDAPLAAKGREFKGWLKVFEDPRLENRQKSILVGFLLVVIASMAIAINTMLPLKQMMPYFIESDGKSGSVAVSTRVAREFKPDQNNVAYFVKIFIRDLLTIDSRLTTELYFPEASAMVRGNALQQIRQYIVDNKVLDKIASDPNFKRDVKLISVPSFISDGVVLARYQLSNDPKRYAMTLHYAFVLPTTDEERLRNPIGFYITDLVINEEL